VDENQAVPQVLADGRAFFPPNSPRRNPNFTGMRYKITDGQSYYNHSGCLAHEAGCRLSSREVNAHV
jgi:hypothetical protein